MADKLVTVRLHYDRTFKKTTYSAGKSLVINRVDSAEFSYTVVMEYVKDYLKLSEIGGVYTRAAGGWTLLTWDKELFDIITAFRNDEELPLFVDTVVDKEVEPSPQMQPHVIVRPRKNLIQGIYSDVI